MGLAGILLALGLLVWLSYRGWSILLLAPAAALIAAAAAGEPLLAHWTQTFMGGAAQFLAQFFPLFLLGALFGKLMEDSGSVEVIARFMTEKLGTGRAMLAVVLAGGIVTYGGVSLFVAIFVIVPMAQGLFKAADIPLRLMPAAIALGTMTFTMSALPGTPALQNAIPMPFFGTTPFAAPGLGIIAAAIILAFGLWWLGRAERAARCAGESYGAHGGAEMHVDDPSLRERATIASEFDPAEIVAWRHLRSPARCLDRAVAADRRHSGQSCHERVRAAATRYELSRGGAVGSNVSFRGCRRVGGGRGVAGGNRDFDRAQLPSPAIAPGKHGCRRECLGAPCSQRLEPGGFWGGDRGAARLCAWCATGYCRLKAVRLCRLPSPPTSSPR